MHAPAINALTSGEIRNLALKRKLKMASTLEEMAQLFAIKTTNLKRSMELRSAGKCS